MKWSFLQEPGIWPASGIIVLACVLGWYSWRRRTQPGALPFALACLSALVWALGSVGQLVATDSAAQDASYVVRIAMLLPMVSAMTGFVFQYAGLGRWLTRPVVMGAFVIPSAAFAALAASNAVHGLIWPTVDAARVGSHTPVLGAASWVFAGYHLLLALVDLAVLVRLFAVAPGRRWPVALMVAGILFSRVAYGFEVLAHGSFITDDPEVAAVGLPLALYAIVLRALHVFDPVPQARQAAVDQMRDAVLVLGPSRERIVYANPAAEALFGTSLADLQGRPAAMFLPAGALGGVGKGHEDLGDRSGRQPSTTIRLGQGEPGRDVVLDVTDLVDATGHSSGLLLLLRDVTVERRAQAHRLDQQRALAALREREQLARELHDSIGQVLGYVSVQAQAAQKWLLENDVPQAVSLLTRLTEVARKAHDDVREAIISLKSSPDKEWSFRGALVAFAHDFERQSGIVTTVTMTPREDVDPFDPAVGVQALRVVQEAMSNARHHGNAGSVDILVVREESEVCITVSDDGNGFVEPTEGTSDGHYGITFMRERMAEIGGSLIFSSGPGQMMTHVIFRIPVGSRREGAA